ncbi:RNA recognition motif-containing protein [Saitoella coloradoensis]
MSDDSGFIPLETASPKPVKTTGGAKPGKDDDKNASTLFVRSIPYSVTSEALEAFFSDIGPIKSTVIITDQESGKSRGFGFVRFAMKEDATRAMEELKSQKLEGRALKMEVAERRQRKDEDGEKKDKVVKVREDVVKAQNRAVQKKKDQDKDLRPRLIVRNLPWSVRTPAQIQPAFEPFGTVKEVSIPRGRGGKMSGFGFVEMGSREEAEKAVEGVNGTEIEGRTVAVDFAVGKDAWEKMQDEEEDEENDEEDDDEEEDEDEDEDDMDPVQVPSDYEEDEDEDMEDDEQVEKKQSDTRNRTLFIRNLPFDCDDDKLHQKFRSFGPLQYAKVVVDHSTGRSRGTGFVCFKEEEDSENCLYAASKIRAPTSANSILLPGEVDADSEKFMMEGRVLTVTAAVSREDAEQLKEEGEERRRREMGKGADRRNLFLLNEGAINKNSKLFSVLPESEKQLRAQSQQQRKKLLDGNPSLHLSLTRLAIRNIPKSVTGKDLKVIARKAFIQFATDVKEGKREALSKEEIYRDGNPAYNKKKGVVKQAKVVMEKDGKSKGYGFVELVSHRWALMCLRGMNGIEVCEDEGELAAKKGGNDTDPAKKGKAASPEKDDEEEESNKSRGGGRKRRLIVEFAIENVKVVKRRREREEHHKKVAAQADKEAPAPKPTIEEEETGAGKRKRSGDGEDDEEKNKKAKAARIISQKRAKRKNNRKGK